MTFHERLPNGETRPVAPEPRKGLRLICGCGAKFWTRDLYLTHWHDVHGMEAMR